MAQTDCAVPISTVIWFISRTIDTASTQRFTWQGTVGKIGSDLSGSVCTWVGAQLGIGNDNGLALCVLSLRKVSTGDCKLSAVKHTHVAAQTGRAAVIDSPQVVAEFCTIALQITVVVNRAYKFVVFVRVMPPQPRSVWYLHLGLDKYGQPMAQHSLFCYIAGLYV